MAKPRVVLPLLSGLVVGLAKVKACFEGELTGELGCVGVTIPAPAPPPQSSTSNVVGLKSISQGRTPIAVRPSGCTSASVAATVLVTCVTCACSPSFFDDAVVVAAGIRVYAGARYSCPCSC
ncbi:hypothetical protein EDD21DRAFT_350979 [Dissophora ornata]|nr:hypothetical protein EDD21DRAFT_350979 [Dissophora ornata]